MHDTASRPEPLRFALSGIHGSGKTTLCHQVVGRLRREGILVALASESARQSLRLTARTINPGMEIEIMGLQLVEEMRAACHADVVICDRSILDTAAYTLARFPAKNLSLDDAALTESIYAFGPHYIRTYAGVFYLSSPILVGSTGDEFRDTDPVSTERVQNAFEHLMKQWNVAPIVLELETALDTLMNSIHETIQKRSRK
jgi:thymidylate kinase